MEFRRVGDLPPYVFATVDELKRRLRRDGRDVVDLGFGNPDIPSPSAVLPKLAEDAARPSKTRSTAHPNLPPQGHADADRPKRCLSLGDDPQPPNGAPHGGQA